MLCARRLCVLFLFAVAAIVIGKTAMAQDLRWQMEPGRLAVATREALPPAVIAGEVAWARESAAVRALMADFSTRHRASAKLSSAPGAAFGFQVAARFTGLGPGPIDTAVRETFLPIVGPAPNGFTGVIRVSRGAHALSAPAVFLLEAGPGWGGDVRELFVDGAGRVIESAGKKKNKCWSGAARALLGGAARGDVLDWYGRAASGNGPLSDRLRRVLFPPAADAARANTFACAVALATVPATSRQYTPKALADAISASPASGVADELKKALIAKLVEFLNTVLDRLFAWLLNSLPF